MYNKRGIFIKRNAVSLTGSEVAILLVISAARAGVTVPTGTYAARRAHAPPRTRSRAIKTPVTPARYPMTNRVTRTVYL